MAEALDAPGEWYLDRSTGFLTYIPHPGETPQDTEVIAPVSDALIVLQGDPGQGRFVMHLEFRGLVLEHTNWVTPPQGYAFVQAELPMRGAVRAEGARNCVFEDCAIRHVAGYAMEWGPGSQRNRVERCDLTDLGAGGIRMGDGQMRDDPRFAVTGNIIRDNRIAQGGRTHPAGVGVLITHAAHNTIEHNEIADFYYTAISVGWSWGYAPTVTHHNTIAANHLHDIGQGVLSDMGGIYTLGVSPGTVLRGNRIHDIRSHTYGGWGIYFDEGSSGILARDNLVYRTRSAPFHQHYGRDNRVENNILAFGGEAQLMRTRAEDHLSFSLEHNIIHWTDPASPLLGSNWTGDRSHFKLDHNLYGHGGHPVTFNGQTLEQWQQSGQDVNSIVADPLFVDPQRGDFRLSDESPALRVGFEPFNLAVAGLLTVRDGPAPIVPPAFPLDAGSPPPLTIFDDFEETPVGDTALGATTSEERDHGTIRISDDRAASGRRSLQFTDAAGQEHAFNPHLYYRPGYQDGIIEEQFHLWLEPGTDVSHEWRTWPRGASYHAGPSIHIAPDGTLSAGGRVLGRVPHRQWLTIRIVCSLDGRARQYTLSVQTLEEGRTLYEAALPLAEEFTTVDWVGFVSNATERIVFHIDDLSLQRRP